MYRNKISETQPRHFSIRSRKFYKEIATCIFVIIRNTCNTNFFLLLLK